MAREGEPSVRRFFRRKPITTWMERVAQKVYARTVRHDLQTSLKRMETRLQQQTTLIEQVVEARIDARYADLRDLLYGDRRPAPSIQRAAGRSPDEAYPAEEASLSRFDTDVNISGCAECTAHFLDHFEICELLDIGCGRGGSFASFVERGIKVTGIDILPEEIVVQRINGRPIEYIREDFMCFSTQKRYDAVFSSHVIEHIPDTQAFLRKMFSLLVPNGAYCIIWPRPKSAIVGGHVHCFNIGLMLYNLVLLGINCQEVLMVESEYSLAVMGRHKTFEIPSLAHDNGDIERLADYFPCKAYQSFDGDRITGVQQLSTSK